MDARAAAAKAVFEVLDGGRSLSTALPAWLERTEPREDRPLTQELAYGALRWQPRLALMLQALLARPLRGKDHDLWALLLVGAYQLSHTAIPPHAAVTETVNATGALDKEWARGLVNGVLRNYLRRRDALAAAADGSDEGRWAHPQWLKDAIAGSWPGHWEAVLEADNARPPLTLRVNCRRLSRADYLAALAAHGLSGTAVAHTEAGVVLHPPLPVTELPGYDQGWFSVQDGAAQLAAPLLQPRPGERILDACCAPGGKTAHLLELCPDSAVTALDQSPRRLAQVRDTLRRLGLSAAVTAGDAATPADWWDGQPYDRILLDTPCSATGVIRRHPDIKALRRACDIAALAARQRRLLEALWPLLRAGGVLLYTTCSVLTAENRDRVREFMSAHPDAREDPIAAAWGHAAAPGRQVLSGEDDMDGFYFARLIKDTVL